MTSSAQQNRDRYLASKFLSLGLICSKDFIEKGGEFPPLRGNRKSWDEKSSLSLCVKRNSLMLN